MSGPIVVYGSTGCVCVMTCVSGDLYESGEEGKIKWSDDCPSRVLLWMLIRSRNTTDGVGTL